MKKFDRDFLNKQKIRDKIRRVKLVKDKTLKNSSNGTTIINSNTNYPKLPIIQQK